MTAEKAKQFRARLEAMAARLGGTIAGLEDQARTPTGGEAAGGLSNAPFHLADVGSEAYTQELGATLLENEAFLRDEVAAALERLDGNTFGACERCGTAIPLERLDALPYTRYCTPCSADVQAGKAVNLNDGRPDRWLGVPGHEGLSQTGSPGRVVGREIGGAPGDVHAAGTPGGGAAWGGLAGTNIGGGSPDGVNLEESAAGPDPEPKDERADEETEARSGPAGGAVGGTPANKRSRGA